MTLEDVKKNFFYFMTFIPKLHILSTRGKETVFFTIFGHISAIWRTSLLKWKKVNEIKKVRLVDTYLECGLRFFIFSKERLQNVKKPTKKVGKNSVHDFTRCALSLIHI